jgi:hypothetical protein
MQSKTEKTIESIEAQAAQLENSEEAALEKEVLTNQKKIKQFNFLINDYEYSSNAFGFLENLTHPKVYFSSFSLNIESGEMSLSGMADGFESLNQQLEIFQQEPKITTVTLSNVGFSEDSDISFSFVLKLDPTVFQK